jgi:hypothetical protein
MIPFTPDERRAEFAPSQNPGGPVDPDVLAVLGQPAQEPAMAQPTMNQQVDPDVLDIVNRDQIPLMSSLMSASRVNPDQAAEASRLGARIGVGQDVALRNMDEVRQRAFMADMQARDIARTNPVLASFLMDRTFANQASDDVGTLEKLAQTMDYVSELPSEFMAGFRTGRITTEAGLLGTTAQLRGKPTEDEQRQWNAYQQELADLAGDTGFWRQTGELLGQLERTAEESVKGAVVGGGVGAGAALLAGQFGPQIFLPEEIVTVPAATIFGMGAGATSVMRSTSGRVMAGNNYMKNLDAGMDPDVARVTALGVGLLGGALEAYGLKLLAVPFKGMWSRMVMDAANEAVTRPTVGKAIANFGTSYAKGVGGEIATEVSQQVVEIAFDEMGGYISDPEAFQSRFATREGRQSIKNELTDVIVRTALGVSAIGGIGPGINIAIDLRRAKAATTAGERIQQLVDRSKQLKLRTRNPDAAENIGNQYGIQSGIEQFYVDATVMRGVMEQAGLKPSDINAVIPGLADRIATEAERGGDVTITPGQLIARIAGTPFGDAITPHLRVAANALSVVDAQAVEASRAEIVAQAETLMEEKQTVDAAFVQSAQAVEDSIFNAVKAVGYSDVQARTYAKIHQAMVVVDAAAMGITPEEYNRTYQPTIVGAGMPVQAMEQAAVPEPSARVIELIPTSRLLDERGFGPITHPVDGDEVAAGQAMRTVLGGIDVPRKYLKTPEAFDYLLGAINQVLLNKSKDSTDYDRTAASMGRALRTDLATVDDIVIAAKKLGYAGIDQDLRLETEAALTKTDVLEVLDQIPFAPEMFNQAARIDADYAAAVERGDMATAQRMVNEAARAAGYNETGFHGLGEGVLEGSTFDVNRRGKKTGAKSAKMGFFFASQKTAETYAAQVPVDSELRQISRAAARVAREFIDSIPPKYRKQIRSTLSILQEQLDRGEEAFMPDGDLYNVDIDSPASFVGQVTDDLYELFPELIEDVLDVWPGDSQSKREWESQARRRYLRELDPELARLLKEGKGQKPVLFDAKLKMQNPLVVDFKGKKTRPETYADIIRRAIKNGHDSAIIRNTYDTMRGEPVLDDIKVVFDPAQIKSAEPVTRDEAGNVVPLSRRFDITSPRIFEQAAKVTPGPNAPGVGVAPENKLGFWPALRVMATGKQEIPDKPLILTGTTNKNAAKQLESIDDILGRFPTAGESVDVWTNMLSYAFGTKDVPVAPYAFIRDINGTGSFDRLSTLTAGQIADASHGFENARAFRQAYINGELDVITTGKLFLWSFLSRGVSPYTQESLFIDAFKGADKWIQKAAKGKFTKRDFAAYEKWAKSVAPQGSGQPGAGATHNLNAFGKNFLFKMGAIGSDGKSNLQRLHEMISDPNQTGKMIRREFAKFGEGVGIDNKVVSFTLLVAGFNDVMVLDRVQVRQLWDDGRFSGTNLYDGVMNDDGKKLAGSSLNAITEGVRGILIYEAIERQLASRINDLYAKLGRPQDASIGRYHWETWVAYSQQEAAHATLDAILLDAKGDDQAIAKVSGKQGEYGAYEYGAQYNRDEAGNPWFRYVTPLGGTYDFSVPAFRNFLAEIKKAGNKVVPSNFKVSESGNAPWYTRREVNQQRLEEQAAKWSDRGGGTGEGKRLVDEAAANADAIRARSAAGEQPAGRSGILEQAASGPARGGFDPRRLTTIINKGADVTTLFHELIHYKVEVYLRIASAPDAPARIKADLDELFKFMGVAGATFEERLATYNGLTFEQRRPLEEKITYNFEDYLLEGKAPSVEMRGVFDRIAAWMRRVYKSLRDDLNAIYKREFGTDLPILTPEIRAVFDRMLASEEQIKRAEAVNNMKGLFQTQAESGMDDATWAAYQAMQKEATDSAIAALTADTMKQVEWMSNARSKKLKELQKAHDTQRKEIRDQVMAEVRQEPIYRAMEYLKRGTLIGPDGSEATVEGVHKISTALAREFVPGLDMAKMGRGKYGYLAEDGLHPDIVAEMFGFPAGSALLQALADAKPMREVVDARTDEIMVRDYSEMGDPKAQEAAVNRAIHNEARARLVAVEARWLSRATQPVRVIQEAARQAAVDAVGNTVIRDLRPDQYAAAEARASRDAIEAARGADTKRLRDRYGADATREQVMLQAKRQQLYQNALATEAQKADDAIQKGLKYLRRVLRDSNRQRMGADYADQIAGILDRFELAPISRAEAARRADLAAWVEAKRAEGLEPDIDPEVLAESNRRPWRNLTVTEFNAVMDAVKQIEFMGKNERKIKLAAEKADFEKVRDEIVTSVIANAGDRKANARTATTNIGRAITTLKGFVGAHLKAASIARILDGAQDGGPVWNYLIRSANDAGDKETTMRAQATERLTAMFAPIFKLGKMGGKGQYFPTVDRSFNREARLVIALNMGNDGNIQRLLDGEGWSIEQITPILQSLTEEEWNLVQQVWDYFETYRPEIAAKERELYGKEPNWVEPKPMIVQTADGKTVTLRGGYYPIKYDPRASMRAETMSDAEAAKRDLAGAFTSATTRRSYTKSRVKEVKGRPLLYTLAGMYGGVNEVIHDLSWHRWLIQANRLMRSQAFDEAVREKYGPEFIGQLKTWIKDVAAGERGVQNEAEMALNFLRQGISSAGLGFNVVSAALQITGFNQSIVRVGVKWIGRGIAAVAQSPLLSMKMVNEKSDFMANRARTQFRELNELRNMVQGDSVAMRRIKMGTYFLMMRMQRMVDVPTWIGAYEKALYEGRDEDTSIALADQAVIDSQGGGMLKDLSRVERGGAGLKLFTVFYGYMNTVYNMAAVQTMTAKNKGKLAADYAMLFVVPVALGQLIRKAMVPKTEDEPEDLEAIARKLAAEQLSYLMGTMVIVREFGEISKIVAGAEGPRMGYGGPAGLRAVGETYNFATQASQGEFDKAFRKSAVNLIGAFTGLPSAQINRTLDGLDALYEGETENVLAPATGVRR